MAWQDYLPDDRTDHIITRSHAAREVRRQEWRDRISATLYMLAFWAAVLLCTALIATAFAEPAALAIHTDCPTRAC